MLRSLFLLTIGIFYSISSFAQDTTFIQTLTYDSTGRNYIFSFPPDDGTTYEKIIMEYNMRCKGALVSTGSNTNLGCGEWDYSCNTYIVDSTYTDSLKTLHPSHIISGFGGDVFNLTYSPTYTYTLFDQYQVEYSDTISENFATTGTGTFTGSSIFNIIDQSNRSQFIWTAAELSDAGLNPGAISSLRLNLAIATSDAQFFRIKMKHSSKTELDPSSPDLDGFTEVYFSNTSFAAGDNDLLFYNNFIWDGISNIIIDFSYTNNGFLSENSSYVDVQNPSVGIRSLVDIHSLDFTGSEYLQLPTNDFENISNEITISFWSYGDSDQLPIATTILEGVDDLNQRQANIHLPWGNSRIYWDCGNDGNYDRIDKAANLEDFAGKWNHWAFTKNAGSGEMKIYLNGALWHSGTNKTKPIDITAFTLGSSINQGRFYYGGIDEFRIWKTELNETEIANWMHRRLSSDHPQYQHLISHYKMEEATGVSVQNDAPAGGTATINGSANWKKLRGADLFKGFVEDFRPFITLVQGEYVSTTNTVEVFDTLINNQIAVTSYQVNGTDLATIGTEYVWQADYEYLYNEAGEILDSFPIFIDETINIEDLIYYRKFPSEFEIMSFVTPYGINLDLGENGKTWTFDVTDFAPILKDDKRMLMKLGGQNQEEMDIRFLFIEGTPPSEVKNIQQIWRSGSGYSYTAIMSDAVLEPRDILLDSQGEYFKIRTMVTGHGQEGEFTPRTHWVNIDGGDPEFEWSVWTSCGNNPIFPQGGTWIYDRAGWCPGAPTDLQEWDITDMVNPGSSVNVDYNVTAGAGDSRYITSHQLVTYGPANFSLDAAITEIKRPTKQIEYDRTNPICNDPIVVLKNTGATTLTNATITYQVQGGNSASYEWTGNLDFMESEEVVLPVSDVSFWAGDEAGIFSATVSAPNTGADGYAQNNTLTSSFELPDIYDNETFIIALNTNAFASQNSYTLKDINGNIITSANNFSPNTFYRDTVTLVDGCYTLELQDTGGNGLEFWAQPNQGSGNFYVRGLANVLKTFEPDFGSSITYSFVKGQITNVETPEFQTTFEVFPNPNLGQFEVLVDFPNHQDATLFIYDATGRLIQTEVLENFINGKISLDISNRANGIYHCTLVTKDWTLNRKVVKQ